MKEKLYVIATRGRNNKEIYLAVDESREDKNNPFKTYFKWTENIEEAIADFWTGDLERQASNYFKNFKKWYIKSYDATFR